MSEETGTCLVCGEPHSDVSAPSSGCPAMRAAQATDARPENVPVDVYSGYLNAREALRANAPQAAIKGLRGVLSTIAHTQGARPDEGFSAKIDQLCNKGVIGARIRNALLKQALSESVGKDFEEAQAWALMSIAEHAFYRLYLSKGRAAT